MIRRIKFRRQNDEFQTKLSKQIADIKKSDDLVVPSDKTKNFYSMPVEQYECIVKNIQIS